MPLKNQSLELSPAQQAILDSNARIKVVSACPGAGKTRMFVAALNHYKASIVHGGSGIAALSFTNVAQNEIGQRLGGWGPPDFIGTIDSFLLRFVLRPFGHLVGLRAEGARLVPASLYSHSNHDVRVGDSNRIRAKVHDISFVGEANGTPVLSARGFFKNADDVHPSAYNFVLNEKRKMWKNFGQFSHSDSHYLCDKILQSAHGAAISAVIARRFPVILIDELQDTQYFLGQALMRLYECPLVAGLVVGDPDQAIYEFGGAHPALFEGISSKMGARSYTLDVTHRCSASICKTAVHLSSKPVPIKPASNEVTGQCILLVLSDGLTDVCPVLASNIEALHPADEKVAILTRKNETVSKLKGRATPGKFPGPSKLAARTHSAVQRLVGGDATSARKMIEADLAEIIFGKWTKLRDSLSDARIPSARWNTAVGGILFNAARIVVGESWEVWQGRVKAGFAFALENLGEQEKLKKLGQRFRLGPKLKGLRALAEFSDTEANWGARTTLFNVHEMKGLESTVVCYYVPHEPKTGRKISEVWWESGSEERRIAFVAFTRAERLFILAVHQSTFEQLKAARPEFVATFQVIPVAPS